MGILSIGVSGLNAAQAGLLTTSHNISNASTPGYSRQENIQAANLALRTGAGFVGQGTHINDVRRSYDQFLGRQILSADAGAAEMQSYQAQITQIDNMLADTASGLSPSLSAFFKGVQDVSANPTSLAARQSMLSSAQALAGRFQALDQRLTEIRTGTNQQIATQVTQINAYSSQIADINQSIIFARAGSSSHEPNDLLDQREQMVRDLNKLIRVTTVTQGDGSYNVFVGAGQPLVVGDQVNQLKAINATDDAERVTVAMVGSGGTSQSLSESQLTGGSLGGVLRFRSQSLDEAQNALGRIATTLAQNVNQQHQLGQDLTGAMGQAIFSVSPPRVSANSLNSGTGTPSVAIDATSIAELTTSDYRLRYTGANYSLVKLSDNSTRTFASLPQTVDGMTITAGTWSPNANDSILIQPTRTAAQNIIVSISDPRQVAAAAPIRSSAAMANSGTASVDAGTVDGPPPANANLKHKVTLSFTSATTFDVVDVTAGSTLATGVAYSTGNDISYNGWTTKIKGTPATGDVFTVESNVNGVGDNRNAARIGALQTGNTMSAGNGGSPTATYQGAYAQMVSAVGSKTNEVSAIASAQQGLADQATQALQSVAGVNLDEEAANLLRYQQAYQAAAKVLEIANRIFDEVLGLGR